MDFQYLQGVLVSQCLNIFSILKKKSIDYSNRQLLSINSGILQTRIDHGGGDHITMNFNYFQTQKLMSQRDRSELVDNRNGVICLDFMCLSSVVVLQLPKMVNFLVILRRPQKYCLTSNESRYSRMDQVKFLENSL